MFPIVIVPPDAAELSEQMGTKFKFWYLDEQRRRTLFKEGRPGTGENWAEKISAELADLLGIPHAHYDFAEWKGRAGVVSPSLVARGDRLIHGNELVEGKVRLANAAEKLRYYEQRSHIASRAFQFLKKNAGIILPPPSVQANRRRTLGIRSVCWLSAFRRMDCQPRQTCRELGCGKQCRRPVPFRQL